MRGGCERAWVVRNEDEDMALGLGDMGYGLLSSRRQ
jgi:hypothetical protein